MIGILEAKARSAFSLLDDSEIIGELKAIAESVASWGEQLRSPSCSLHGVWDLLPKDLVII
ncbi:hypothetical protein OUZ56_003663 [Daphnia magna]|uniref:Uncharacterized protein n=1 Tax=Daphnia magna TaxID=35525 RepID=A0ABR0A9D1_9CRUS|nr:hypothetical protein OUZ56_003663 [Daphnia magna]